MKAKTIQPATPKRKLERSMMRRSALEESDAIQYQSQRIGQRKKREKDRNRDDQSRWRQPEKLAKLSELTDLET